MTNQQRNVSDLNILMDRVIGDTEHYLEDLKGQKRLKRLYKKDVLHLQEHLHKLMERVNYLESEHAV